MKVDAKEATARVKADVERHNKIFLFKFHDRIQAIKSQMEKLGKKHYQYPIIKDKDGRMMWANRKYRRAKGIS